MDCYGYGVDFLPCAWDHLVWSGITNLVWDILGLPPLTDYFGLLILVTNYRVVKLKKF